jgi:hypothetical protein
MIADGLIAADVEIEGNPHPQLALISLFTSS